jgi:hypothetical protein
MPGNKTKPQAVTWAREYTMEKYYTATQFSAAEIRRARESFNLDDETQEYLEPWEAAEAQEFNRIERLEYLARRKALANLD